MRTKLSIAAAGVGLLLSAMPVLAHHSFSGEYSAKKHVKLTGTVTKVESINPHVWIHFDVKDADGKVSNWMVEGGAPNALFRRGFTKNSLAPGTALVIEGSQAKDGSNRINGTSTRVDGKTLFLGSSGTGDPNAPQE